MSIALSALLISATFLGILFVVEYCKRRFKLSSEITRRIAHLSAGILALLAYMLLPVWLYVIAISAIGYVIAFSQYKNVLTSVHAVRRHTYGELFLPIGLLAALLASGFDQTIYIPSVLILTFADCFGGLVSDLFKKQRKMLRGSLVFALTTVVIFLITTHLAWYDMLLVSAALTAIERYSPFGSDNLTVPLACALLLSLF